MKNNSSIKKKILIAFLALICILEAAAILVLYLQQSHTAPTIDFPLENKVLTQAESDAVLDGDYDCLLDDVIVYDEAGQALEGRCVVSNIRCNSKQQYAVVLYQAMDYDGNTGSARRIVYLYNFHGN